MLLLCQTATLPRIFSLSASQLQKFHSSQIYLVTTPFAKPKTRRNSQVAVNNIQYELLHRKLILGQGIVIFRYAQTTTISNSLKSPGAIHHVLDFFNPPTSTNFESKFICQKRTIVGIIGICIHKSFFSYVDYDMLICIDISHGSGESTTIPLTDDHLYLQTFNVQHVQIALCVCVTV